MARNNNSLHNNSLRLNTLLATTAIFVMAMPSAAAAQIVNVGDLVSAADSVGNPGQIVITNPTATSATIDVLAPTVIADWVQFNVPAGTTLDVTNGSAAATATLLNRVIGSGASDIGGTINASDVNLWLINQNGILFGSTSSVNANSFVASTLDVSNADFFDFGNGTDVAGNGSATVNFSGTSLEGITSSGGTITTDGTLFFASQALNLASTLDAGSGRASIVAAADVDVQFSPSSPLGYTISRGTTVATQTVGGSVRGAGVEFQMVTAAGVSQALLQIDAELTATTAVPTQTGILLQASSFGASQPSVRTNGELNSSGVIDINVGQTYTARNNLTGSSINIEAGADVAALNLTATTGAIDIDSLNGGALSLGNLNSASVTSLDTSGEVIAGLSTGGALRVGAASPVASARFSGNISGASADIHAAGDVTLRTANTTGDITIDAASLTTASLTADNILAVADSSITVTTGAVLSALGDGDSLVLSSQTFINNSGASALQTSQDGRFLVYSNDWDTNTSGGILAGNLYNTNYTATPPSSVSLSGDRFVYLRQPSLTISANDAAREYGVQNPDFSVSVSGLRSGDTEAEALAGAGYNTAATSSSDVGDYDINLDGSGFSSSLGYNIIVDANPATLTINPALLSVTANDTSREYGLVNPIFTGSITGFRNGDDDSVISGLAFGSQASAASNVGTYSIGGVGASATNYVFEYNAGTLTVNPARLTVSANDASREYGLTNPALTGVVTGFRNGDDESVILGLGYSTAATVGSDVGSYVISGAGASADNYIFDYASGTLTINPAVLSVAANDASREYGLGNPIFTGSITGFRNGDDDSVISGLAFGSQASAGSNVGTYAIGGAGASADNYIFDYTSGTLTINPALLTVAADDTAREYGLSNPSFTSTISGFRNGDDESVIAGLVYETAAAIESDVGAYAVNASGGSALNYVFDYASGILTIVPASLLVTVNDAAREYGLANPDFTGAITGFRNGDDASVISGLSYNTNAVLGSDVGTYAVVGSGASASNYTFGYRAGALTINPALLTVSANDAAREYGLANPDFAGTITGFRNGDDQSVVSGLVFETAAAIGADVGGYSIIGSGAAADNYIFDYAAGTLTINPALLMVSANDAVREYGLANPVFTGEVTGFRNGDDERVISGLSYDTSASLQSDTGSYLITASGGSAQNYTFGYSPGTLTIDLALLSVAANDAQREYGLANPVLTGRVTGFRNGDDESVISGLVYETGAAIGSSVGRYAINGSGGVARNYAFEYTAGALTIDPALLSVIVNDVTRQFGLANPDFSSEVSGFRNGDDEGLISGLVYETAATRQSVTGDYVVSASGASAPNYSFNYSAGTLTVESGNTEDPLHEVAIPQTHIRSVDGDLIEFGGFDLDGKNMNFNKACKANANEDHCVN